MGKISGFLEFPRELPRRRPIPVRIRDWHEVYEPFETEKAERQGGRCMDCGVPFCQEGCPLGNLIPEWNDLIWRHNWSDAIERLHSTNNFPDFTGRLCPAPCEAACVLGINSDPVTIERIEYEIAEHAFAQGWVTPVLATERTTKRVAVIGSGPAGLACAQQLCRAGHEVVVFERAERPGGLLRYGIPEFKMEKSVLDRRLAQLIAEGVTFRCSTSVGVSPSAQGSTEPGDRSGLGSVNSPQVAIVSAASMLDDFDAVAIATGSTVPRDLAVKGRGLVGVHLAMDYLKAGNLVCEGAFAKSPIDACDKDIVILGGGDTGADCLGTAHRQRPRSVTQLEILPEPPQLRSQEHPWPTWPVILRSTAAHEEGGERLYSMSTIAFVGDCSDERLTALSVQQVQMAGPSGRPSLEPVGEPTQMPCDLAILALGFTGPERHGIVGELDLEIRDNGTIAAAESWATSTERVFVCGDATRGQSLIVWAIAEGRSAAASIDRYLCGGTELPAPVEPGRLTLR
ncbi:MAG: glutamate synthase subunit beta [Acidimicrobiales bacterium]